MATNDRDAKRGPALPADFDDPSIPVLTERLTLPPLEIDFTLPPVLTQPPPPPPPAPAPVSPTPAAPVARTPAAAPISPPVAAPAPVSAPLPAAPPPPAIHGLDTLPPQPLPPAPAPAMAALRVEPRTEATPPEPNWAKLEVDLRESILRELSMRLPQNVEQIVREKMQPGIQAALDRLAAETRVAIAASLRDLVDKAVKAEVAAMRARGK
jgi:hypothetical protein